LYKIPAKTLFIGKNLVFVPECHSTNSLALELSQLPATPDGSVVITSNQTAGRGQRGNVWQSTPGKNLTLSVLLKPGFLSTKNQFFLNIFTSLAIYDLIEHKTAEAVRIKWPNDILVGGRKLCGILIENQIRSTQVSASVIGIGLNVNQTAFELPSATSLAIVLKTELDLQTVMEDLVVLLEKRYLQLREGQLTALQNEYLQRLYWRGEKHLFESKGETFEGIITGIDETGRLSIATNNHTLTFDIKEIRYVE
jgi:BirA family biotin operon repressor/biotin-[acetyl-CoA-carboxylase] ligase